MARFSDVSICTTFDFLWAEHIWSQPGPFEPLITDDLEKYSVINRAKNKKIV